MAIIDVVDEGFHSFLAKKADDYGFYGPKKSRWIDYFLNTSRQEQIVEHLESYFNLDNKKEHRILDVGCGFGGLCIALQQQFEHVFGIEIIKERTEWARKRATLSEIICGSATNLPWPDQYFDLVICIDVFEHIPSKEQEMAALELMRVLKLGGNGFISVPNRFQLIDEHNFVWFATWLPKFIRRKYVKLVSKNESYIQCYERSGYGWKKMFETMGFQVTIEPVKSGKVPILSQILTSRYDIYLTR